MRRKVDTMESSENNSKKAINNKIIKQKKKDLKQTKQTVPTKHEVDKKNPEPKGLNNLAIFEPSVRS